MRRVQAGYEQCAQLVMQESGEDGVHVLAADMGASQVQACADALSL